MLVLHRLEVFSPVLPETLEGARILFFSDLHVSRRGAAPVHRALYRLLRPGAYDLVLYGGDLTWGHRPPKAKARDVLERIGRAATRAGRHGAWFCLGNHDSEEGAAAFARGGARLLANETARAGPFLLGGVRDRWLEEDDLPEVLRSAAGEGDPFWILLAHGPDSANDASRAGVPLVLSGHTHGGQIRLPLLGTPVRRLKEDRRLLSGFFRLCETLLFVTTGVGTSTIPFRNIPADCAVLTLRRGPLDANAARRIYKHTAK